MYFFIAFLEQARQVQQFWYVRYYKKLNCRCLVSGVIIEVLRMYSERNHILGPALAYVCMLSATIY
jgi:hypothetical protein